MWSQNVSTCPFYLACACQFRCGLFLCAQVKHARPTIHNLVASWNYARVRRTIRLLPRLVLGELRRCPQWTYQLPHAKHQIWMDIGAGPDQFRSRPGHPAQWMRIYRDSASPPGRATLQVPCGTRHPATHVLVARPAPGTGHETSPFLLHPPALRPLRERQSYARSWSVEYHLRPSVRLSPPS